MKFNKKIISLIVLSCFIFGSVNNAEAFSFKKNKNKTQVVGISASKNVKKSKKVNEAVPPYTNEVHSVFTLEDCINNAIKYNPGIQAYIYNEEAYKTQIEIGRAHV